MADHDRPPGASDETVEAVGKASEAFEYVERARGHLYSLHQLMGHADLLFGEAAELLEAAGHDADAARFRTEVVGRNILDGRWTFQVVEEFDESYYDAVRAMVRALEVDLMAGRRHVYEAELKEQRRSTGRRHHEARPASTHDEGDHTGDPSTG